MPTAIDATVEAIYRNGSKYTGGVDLLGSDRSNGYYYTLVLKIPFSKSSRIPKTVEWRIRIRNSYAGATMPVKQYCYAWWNADYETAYGGDFISGKGTEYEGTTSTTGSVSSGSRIYTNYITREFTSPDNADRYLCLWGLNAETVYSCVLYVSSNFTVTYMDEGEIEEFEWWYDKIKGDSFYLDKDEWNDFTAKINEKRLSMGLSKWSFETAYSGDNFTADMANDAMEAIQDMGSGAGGFIPEVSRGDPVTANYLNTIVEELNAAIRNL